MNAFARFCATHHVDTSDDRALDRAWSRFEESRKRQTQTRAEREHEKDAEQNVNSDPLGVLR